MIHTKSQSAVAPGAAISVEVGRALMRVRYWIDEPDLDAVALLAHLSPNRSHVFFRPPGGLVQLGLGTAARVVARPAPGEPWPLAEMGDRLRAELEAPLGDDPVYTAFLACAFDPAAPFGTVKGPWRGFAPIELVVPEVLLTLHPHAVETVVMSSAERFPVLERELDNLWAATADLGLGRATPGDLAIEWADDAHRDNVVTALAELARPGLDKVVLAHAVEVTRSVPFEPAQVLDSLRAANPAAYLMSYRPRGGSPVFLGASPERLATVTGSQVVSGALAGSAPRGSTPEEDDRLGRELLGSAKDLDEHAIVGEMIAAALLPLARDIETGPGPRLERLPTVQHLFTPIVGTLEAGRSILDVAAALHPTPAVGGMPRERALEAIRSLEAVPRGLYAGAFGRVDSSGEGDLAVAIRSALLSADRALVYAGGGIVPGSDPDLEVEETKLKLAAVLAALEGGAVADG
jgi:isochorismate synthase